MSDSASDSEPSPQLRLFVTAGGALFLCVGLVGVAISAWLAVSDVAIAAIVLGLPSLVMFLVGCGTLYKGLYSDDIAWGDSPDSTWNHRI